MSNLDFTHAQWRGKAEALQFRGQCFIDGKFCPSRSGKTLWERCG